MNGEDRDLNVAEKGARDDEGSEVSETKTRGWMKDGDKGRDSRRQRTSRRKVEGREGTKDGGDDLTKKVLKDRKDRQRKRDEVRRPKMTRG